MNDHEQQLADEGGARSFGGAAREELQLAFLERFALAADADAKREEVRRALLPDSADALYYGALCDLLEVQAALSSSAVSGEAVDAGADAALRFLESRKAALLATAKQLESTHSCARRAKRVTQRVLLLELEAQSRRAAGGAEVRAGSLFECGAVAGWVEMG